MKLWIVQSGWVWLKTKETNKNLGANKGSKALSCPVYPTKIAYEIPGYVTDFGEFLAKLLSFIITEFEICSHFLAGKIFSYCQEKGLYSGINPLKFEVAYNYASDIFLNYH